MNVNIEVVLDSVIGLYTVLVNGVTILECLAEDELDALTVGEIMDMAEVESMATSK